MKALHIILVSEGGIPEVWIATFDEESASRVHDEACREFGLDPEHPFDADHEVRHMLVEITEGRIPGYL